VPGNVQPRRSKHSLRLDRWKVGWIIEGRSSNARSDQNVESVNVRSSAIINRHITAVLRHFDDAVQLLLTFAVQLLARILPFCARAAAAEIRSIHPLWQYPYSSLVFFLLPRKVQSYRFSICGRASTQIQTYCLLRNNSSRSFADEGSSQRWQRARRQANSSRDT